MFGKLGRKRSNNRGKCRRCATITKKSIAAVISIAALAAPVGLSAGEATADVSLTLSRRAVFEPGATHVRIVVGLDQRIRAIRFEADSASHYESSEWPVAPGQQGRYLSERSSRCRRETIPSGCR
jgi:hypothetical protein